MEHNITLGILGGGQLGRMSALAAARLGISVIIYCPEEDSPASYVSQKTIVAAYDDEEALKEFSSLCGFISYEFENIPVKTIQYLDTLENNITFPKQALLDVSQDRIKEKSFINESGIKTARWSAVSSLHDIKEKAQEWNIERFVIKTARFGYDGKGQIKAGIDDCTDGSDLHQFLQNTQGQSLIMEEMIDFSCEISMIIARDLKGKTELYGPMLNEHKNHILHTTTVPSGLHKDVIDRAGDAAITIANHVDLRGVLTVEFFVCSDNSVLVNEIAPRTHNSGHWSIDACSVSQFENHVRCVCGLPVGPSERHNDAVMLNLIGDDINDISPHLRDPNANLHLYGKTEAREGRKMGHITFLKPLTSQS